MKLIVTGDWHFGILTDGIERDNDLYKNALHIIKEAEKKDAILVHLGDLFDKPRPDPTSYANIVRLMSIIEDKKIKSIFITGNHDVSNKGWEHALLPLREFKWKHIKIVDEVSLVEIGNIRFVCMPYISSAALNGKDQNKHYYEAQENFISTIKKRKPKETVVIGHFNVDGAVLSNDHILRNIKLGIPKNVLYCNHYKAIFNGHIHKQQIVKNNHGPDIYIPGNIERLNFGERNDTKGYFEVEL